MKNGMISERVLDFIEHVKKSRAADEDALVVLDLRLECRAQRLAEYADWPMSELELIEREVAGYGDETQLTHMLSGNAKPNPIHTVSWPHSPSPFAWT